MITLFRYLASLLMLLLPLTSQAVEAEDQALAATLEQLTTQEDKLVGELDELRDELIAKDGKDAELRDEIVALERELFSLRAKSRELSSILATTLSGDIHAGERVLAIDDGAVKRISMSSMAKSLLGGEERKMLQASELAERELAAIVSRFIANYRKQNAIYEEYMQTGSEARAREIEAEFERLADDNDDLALDIDDLWSEIYDDKLYAYNMLLELASRVDLLDRGDDLLTQPLFESSDGWASEELGNYIVKKSQLLAYEKMLCDSLKLSSAADSLRGAITLHKSSQSEYPPLELVIRSFIAEEPILFSSAPHYSTKNPIPAMKIYEHGVLYRLLLGEFASKQSVSLFRGAYPLSYYIAPSKKWLYFAGCYSSLSEAEAARKLLLKHGFKKPEVMMITNGKMHNITRHPLSKPTGYRIEIIGGEELPDKLNQLIESMTGERELVRISPETYLLGLIPTRNEADKLITEISSLAPRFKLRLVEVLPEK
ncbi:MAG: hypothetical protein SNH41_02950 [Rikenellaceae bacterium]